MLIIDLIIYDFAIEEELKFENINLEYLRNDKGFQKARRKQEKELEALRKRQAKEKAAIQKQQCTSVEKAVKGKE